MIESKDLWGSVRPRRTPGKNGRIACSGYDGNDYEIYTITPRGGDKFQVTNNNRDDHDPSYSPSGKKIAYSGDEGPNGDYEIYTINAGGGGKFNVTDNGTDNYTPSWGAVSRGCSLLL